MDEFEILSRNGYQVKSLSLSGEAALEKVRAEHPDVIIMEVLLQREMTGCEAAEKIRQEYGIPVVYVTAHGQSFSPTGLKLPAGIKVVGKPFSEESLTRAVEEALAVG